MRYVVETYKTTSPQICQMFSSIEECFVQYNSDKHGQVKWSILNLSQLYYKANNSSTFQLTKYVKQSRITSNAFITRFLFYFLLKSFKTGLLLAMLDYHCSFPRKVLGWGEMVHFATRAGNGGWPLTAANKLGTVCNADNYLFVWAVVDSLDKKKF